MFSTNSLMEEIRGLALAICCIGLRLRLKLSLFSRCLLTWDLHKKYVKTKTYIKYKVWTGERLMGDDNKEKNAFSLSFHPKIQHNIHNFDADWESQLLTSCWVQSTIVVAAPVIMHYSLQIVDDYVSIHKSHAVLLVNGIIESELLRLVRRMEEAGEGKGECELGEIRVRR